jgi:hypothetical protein
MLNFDAWFNPWTFVPFVALLLLHGLFLKGACGAFNRSVDDNPSASIETPSYLRSLSILVIMFSFLVFANWGMSTAMSNLMVENMEPVMSHLPSNHEGEPLVEHSNVFQVTVATLWGLSGLLQFVFCALLMMYGFNIRYRQANVIAFLFAQRAVLYSSLLAGLLCVGAGLYLQRAQSAGTPNPEATPANTETIPSTESISDTSSSE